MQFAAAYRERGQIELFFKALKQNLKIKTFVGTSANAVRIQIWTALIATLLLKILQFKSTSGWALGNFRRPDAAWSGFLFGTRGLSQALYARMKSNLLAVAKTKGLLRREYGEVLAGIILAGWGSRDAKTQARFVANEEMRDVLLEADDVFRSRILWQIERWLESEELSTAEKWSQMLPQLLRDVWPRQKSAKTPTISARLCELAFSNVKLFPQIADFVLPMLANIDREHLMLPNLRESKDNIADLYPHKT
jgi:Transposase DDE domain